MFNLLTRAFFVSLVCISGINFAAEILIEQGVTYATVGDVELKLDLARPTTLGLHPGIVFIHGGGWYQGNRQGYRDEIEEAAKRGYVAVSISYRLMKFDEQKRDTAVAKPIFPAQIHDCKAAVRWLRSQASKYQLDPQRIGVTGGSAGGHLSLLVGLTDASAKLEGDSGNTDQSSRVQAVVNIYGPTEMASCYRTSSVAWIFRLFMGGSPDVAESNYRAASPISYASVDDPPVLTIHGDRDLLVPIDQAKKLDQAIKGAGAKHQLLILEGQGHGFRGEENTRAQQAMWAFFDEHLKP